MNLGIKNWVLVPITHFAMKESTEMIYFDTLSL